ncbi:putative high nitrogen upregulated cytochrome P450 monooxygenase 2 [Lyophyllum shimeji]|uniref:High nitrogen upregulated cytochrome P450 monooxygenase 2 n=1 Tax=Lyophyllum shimeji TaxID=47721 RepID=A0A9P3URA1_LYOSH|nr:putative high nitrogen upregulated cytochrome P450 monooxygenase 2 [Lyophyllum shimeji]
MQAQTQFSLQVVLMAVLTHLCFRKFEPKSLAWPAAILLLEPIVVYTVSPAVTRPSSAGSILTVYALFLGSLTLSIILYRISPFHPLAKYPGPLLNKITQLRSVWVQYSGFQHVVTKQLHDQYGPFVRIGPNELSVADVDAALAILGPGGLPKGRYYEARQDPRAPGNLLTLKGQEHSERRRLWSRAFTTESLAQLEDALAHQVESLVDRLAIESKTGAVDLSKWLSLFALDFMGDMAFGQDFGLLRTGQDREDIRSMFDDFMLPVSVLAVVPWAVSAMQRLPFVSRNVLKLRRFAVDHGMARIKQGAEKKDLWYHLSDEAGLEKERPPVSNIIADSALAMIAGADTTATGLGNLFYLLLSHPGCLERLRAEIDEVYPKGESAVGSSKHSQLPYLTACVNEALRVLPPALTSGPRQVPEGSGGRVFAGRYIPEGTQVYVPPYSMHHNPAHFSPRTDEFVPERWLAGRADDNQVFNVNAFIPFSFGPANCVGRSVARREMMMVASAIVQKFDLRYADGFDGTSWLGNLHDHFTTKRGPLLVTLAPRL